MFNLKNEHWLPISIYNLKVHEKTVNKNKIKEIKVKKVRMHINVSLYHSHKVSSSRFYKPIIRII